MVSIAQTHEIPWRGSQNESMASCSTVPASPPHEMQNSWDSDRFNCALRLQLQSATKLVSNWGLSDSKSAFPTCYVVSTKAMSSHVRGGTGWHWPAYTCVSKVKTRIKGSWITLLLVLILSSVANLAVSIYTGWLDFWKENFSSMNPLGSQLPFSWLLPGLVCINSLWQLNVVGNTAFFFGYGWRGLLAMSEVRL